MESGNGVKGEGGKGERKGEGRKDKRRGGKAPTLETNLRHAFEEQLQ